MAVKAPTNMRKNTTDPAMLHQTQSTKERTNAKQATALQRKLDIGLEAQVDDTAPAVHIMDNGEAGADMDVVDGEDMDAVDGEDMDVADGDTMEDDTAQAGLLTSLRSSSQ